MNRDKSWIKEIVETDNGFISPWEIIDGGSAI